MMGEKIIIDSDITRLYGVSTKRPNEQVKRNKDRFRPDFMFQLTSEKKAEAVANCDHLMSLKSGFTVRKKRAAYAVEQKGTRKQEKDF
jgi:hypothetical protein